MVAKRNILIGGGAVVAVGLILGLGLGLGLKKHSGTTEVAPAGRAPPSQAGKPLAATVPSVAPSGAAQAPAAAFAQGFAPAMAAEAATPAAAPAGNVLVRPGSEEAAASAPGSSTTPQQAAAAAAAAGLGPAEQQQAAQAAALANPNRVSGNPIQAPEAAEPAAAKAPAPAVNLDDPSLYGDVTARNAQHFKGDPIDCVNVGATSFLNSGSCSALTDYYHPLAPQMQAGNVSVLRSLAAAAPTPSDECCVDLRNFIEHGCSCDPALLTAAPGAGYTPQEIMVGAGVLQLSVCAAPSAGGPIFNPCTMTVGRMYLNEAATTTTGRRMLGAM